MKTGSTGEAVLDVRDLRVFVKRDPSVVLVDRVSMSVRAGESVGIIGETGSGKSLTALAIAGLLSPDLGVDGSVEFGGQDLLQLPERDLRAIRGARIGMVFQDPNESLNPVFSIGKQLGYAIRAHAGDLSRTAIRARARELLDLVGIPQPAERLGQYPYQLSGGMRQRVMIAMALASDPELLIADEPTTSLDVSVQAGILELIEGLARDMRLATLLITHDLGVVAGQCDRVLAMYAGQVVEARRTRDFTAGPAHPYCQGLLRCVPDPSELGVIRPGIPGTPPAPGSTDQGCRFRDRCEYATDGCESPQLLLDVIDRGASGLVRCWRADELSEPAVAAKSMEAST
ncbi:ABC transporter ATP-binding protein [Pseudonocardia humida]|uniref:ABC transporter ATP-binding protein n=1 Tax=Pseudonocardia humida TaxID=2800819 RepID=A0ABT1A9V3_9PSEU|nr:ABC transporter ATP-binding protein [Pseudonocardia humida]MCO1659705.1 ABC transporter ATP-binding protein [Pseudonocardia humida]